MNRFLFKSILFLLPFILAFLVELFILPIDFFTFRVWEALLVKKYRTFFAGHFYPNMEISRIEEGDLAAHTKFAVEKKVRWVTDRYGYRKQNTDVRKHEVVIIGESNIAGISLSQEEILSEVLGDRLKVSVYPYAPVGGINTFLKDERFLKNSPDIVVFARIERELLDLDSLKPIREGKWSSKLRRLFQESEVIQSFAIRLDRISKMAMLHYFRSGLRRSISPTEPRAPMSISSQFGPIFFIQGKSANGNVSKQKLDRAVQVIKSYDEAIKKRGMRFIFLPIPNKENIFYRDLETARPVFLERLIYELKRDGVETIDTQRAFEEAFQKDRILLYHTDDTHWNKNGVKLTSDLLAKTISTSH